MEALCQKAISAACSPTEADPRAEKQLILDALSPALGSVRMALPVMRKPHAVLRDAQWQVTATLAWTGLCWEVVGLAPRQHGRPELWHLRGPGEHHSLHATGESCHRGRLSARTAHTTGRLPLARTSLTRVFYSKDNAAALEEIRQATLATFQEVLEGLEEKSGYPVASCGAMTVAGNTTMMHFLLGLDAFGVFAAPYAPRAMRFDPYPARDLGLCWMAMYCYPCRANYLGGDIISGLVATNPDPGVGDLCFLDIGTNGGTGGGKPGVSHGRRRCAGPALEGGCGKNRYAGCGGRCELCPPGAGNVLPGPSSGGGAPSGAAAATALWI